MIMKKKKKKKKKSKRQDWVGMDWNEQSRAEMKKKKTRREPSFRRQCSGCAETRC